MMILDISLLNSFVVSHANKVLKITFESQRFNISINNKSTFDFWHTITTNKGVQYDVNLFKNSGKKYQLSVYPLQLNNEGITEIVSKEGINIPMYNKKLKN